MVATALKKRTERQLDLVLECIKNKERQAIQERRSARCVDDWRAAVAKLRVISDEREMVENEIARRALAE